jgi:MFS family permease
VLLEATRTSATLRRNHWAGILLNLYSLANWLPTVVRGAGYSTALAVLVGTALQVGGTISPVLLAWLIASRGFVPVLTATFGIATVAVALIEQPGLSLALLVSIVFVAGACVVGGQPSVNALSAMFYPTYLRSTGLGWSLGVGRIGSIVGPVTAVTTTGSGWVIDDTGEIAGPSGPFGKNNALHERMHCSRLVRQSQLEASLQAVSENTKRLGIASAYPGERG